MILRQPITLILLMVLALRSLLPAGFMVQAAHAEAGAGHGLEIVICTSNGLKTILHDDTAPPVKPQHVDNGLCPFGATGSVALASTAPQPLVGVVAYAAVTYALAAAQFAETPEPGATSARGPPSHVI